MNQAVQMAGVVGRQHDVLGGAGHGGIGHVDIGGVEIGDFGRDHDLGKVVHVLQPID